MLFWLIVALLIAVMIADVALIMTTFKHCQSDKRYFFIFCLAAILLTTLGYLFEIAATDTSSSLTGVKIEYVGYCFIPPLFLLFTLDYVRVKMSESFFRMLRVFLYLIGSILLAFVWTEPRHRLFYNDIPGFDPARPLYGLQIGPGFIYPFVQAFAIGCCLISVVLLVKRIIKGSPSLRKIYIAMIITVAAPVLSNVAHLIVVAFMPDSAFVLNFTPFMLFIMIFVLYATVVRFGMFDSVPVAYSVVLNSLNDGFVVVNTDMECLDANPVAIKLFPGIERCRNGIPVTNLESWPAALADIGALDLDVDTEFSLAHGDEERTLSAAADSVTERGKLLGYVFVFRDVTENRRLLLELEKAAHTDGLTGLYNRRHFMKLAAMEFEKAKRLGLPCYAMIFDIDKFKNVNDTYGHHAGDAVLCQISATVTATIRSYDLFARYGGEEFSVLLQAAPDADGAIAANLAERIRIAVASAPGVFHGITIPVTLSIGVASGSEVDTLDELLLRADTAMYKAKDSGRNNVVVYEQMQV
ncbi:MAG: diguanylate cyclase [Oscillospiraceae bacterium]|jgi:diguanylate cyclase (GGDEF)-like protein|nr:diguanylate cyclase [Oscillospiraceae bacterium]